MGSDPRRHHLVPEFYLRKFANDSGRVHVCELPGDRRFTTGVKNVTVETGYYDVAGASPDSRADVERLLATLEGHAARAWSAFEIGAGWPPAPEQLGAIATWITLQYVRGRSGLWRWNEQGRMLLRLQVIAGGRRALRRQLGDATEEEIEKLLREAHDDSMSFRPPRNGYLKTMLSLAANHADKFGGYTWTLMHFERKRLTTCDNPVLLIQEDARPEEGVGLFSADLVAVPVRRDCALLLQRGRPRFDRHVAGTTKFAKSINFLCARNADRYLMHHPDDDPLAGVPLPEPTQEQDFAPHVEDLTRFAPRDEPPPTELRSSP